MEVRQQHSCALLALLVHNRHKSKEPHGQPAAACSAMTSSAHWQRQLSSSASMCADHEKALDESTSA